MADKEATETVTEPEVPELPPGVEGSDADFLFEGDMEKIAAAKAAAESDDTSPQAQVQEEEEQEDKAPPSGLAAFQQALEDQLSEPEGEKKPSVDPRDAELQRARERNVELLEARIADLKEQRGEAPAKPTEPDADEARQARLNAAVSALVKEGWDEDQARAHVITTGELTRMEREHWTEKELKPIQEELAQLRAAREQATKIRSVGIEVQEGLRALKSHGGLAAELAEQFLQGSQVGINLPHWKVPPGQDKGVDSYLGRALTLGWKQEPGTLPPNMQSRETIEAYGLALASQMGGLGGGGSASEEPVAPSTPRESITPKRRRAPTANKQTDAEAKVEELIQATEAEMRDAASILMSGDWQPPT